MVILKINILNSIFFKKIFVFQDFILYNKRKNFRFMFDYSIFEKKTFNELISERDRLEEKYSQIETDCLKDNLSFAEFCNKAHDVKDKLIVVDKFIRMKEDPIMTYGKEWSGTLYEINKFKEMCDEEHKLLTDEDGFGYYATENAKSNIMVKPSDFVYDLVRNDFTHVLWFNK